MGVETGVEGRRMEDEDGDWGAGAEEQGNRGRGKQDERMKLTLTLVRWGGFGGSWLPFRLRLRACPLGRRVNCRCNPPSLTHSLTHTLTLTLTHTTSHLWRASPTSRHRSAQAQFSRFVAPAFQQPRAVACVG